MGDAPSRSQTAEIDLLAANIKALSESLETERREREKDRKQGIAITRLQVPLVALLAVVGVIGGGFLKAGLFYSDTKAHLADKNLHADPAQAIVKNGIAYQKDVDEKVSAAISGVETHERTSLRLIVKQSPISCSGRVREGAIKNLDCKFAEVVPPR